MWNNLPASSTKFSILSSFCNTVSNTYLLNFCKVNFIWLWYLVSCYSILTTCKTIGVTTLLCMQHVRGLQALCCTINLTWLDNVSLALQNSVVFNSTQNWVSVNDGSRTVDGSEFHRVRQSTAELRHCGVRYYKVAMHLMGLSSTESDNQQQNFVIAEWGTIRSPCTWWDWVPQSQTINSKTLSLWSEVL